MADGWHLFLIAQIILKDSERITSFFRCPTSQQHHECSCFEMISLFLVGSDWIVLYSQLLATCDRIRKLGDPHQDNTWCTKIERYHGKKHTAGARGKVQGPGISS